MSRTLIVVLIAILAAIGGGIAWWFTRTVPTDLDIAANSGPDLPAPKFAADDWPWWRGPTSNAQSAGAEAPTSWSEKENVLWKTPIPGRGHSTPILVGKHIFLTSADESTQRQLVICLDRATGDKLWEETVHEKNLPHKHPENSYASSTPGGDGERFFAAFANGKSVFVSAFDLNGEILWMREAGPHSASQNCHGYGSSLAMWGPFVIVSADSPLDGKGWIAAIHRKTGEIAWRQGRKTGMGSYGSPVVAELGGTPHVLLPGNEKLSAYDPSDGKLLWDRGGLAEVSGNSAVFSPTMAFASSGFPHRRLLAFKTNGAVAWRKESDNIPYPPSFLWHDDYLYVVSDSGLASCFDANNGDLKWKDRLGGTSYYSSPLLVGRNIYACDRAGRTTIFEANPESFVEVKSNKLDGPINASPIVAGGKLYIRTETHLYCIGKR